METARYYLLNRALDVTRDGWVHIVPKGELANAAAGMVQVLDDAALRSIVRNLEADKLRLGSRWPGLYAGREHHIYEDDGNSEALAWFKDFQRRPDGIWASTAGLTDIGREAVTNGHYKFTSFVANREDTEALGGNRHRILRVDTIGFTNQANGKELLTPITNRQAPTAAPARPPATASVAPRDYGTTVYSATAAFVANRLRKDYGGHASGHALVAVRNRDLVDGRYDALPRFRNFDWLLNRVENRGGLSSMRAIERSALDATALCKRFAPDLNRAPTAHQWEFLLRSADALEEAGVPDRLCNRAPEGVTASDWKRATGRADDVLALLDAEATRPVDRGSILENATPAHVRGVFKTAIERLMREQNKTRSQAFESLKADEPVFWTLAMLSFEP